MKMMLSMPRTISSTVSVRRATQASGLVSHSMCREAEGEWSSFGRAKLVITTPGASKRGTIRRRRSAMGSTSTTPSPGRCCRRGARTADPSARPVRKLPMLSLSDRFWVQTRKERGTGRILPAEHCVSPQRGQREIGVIDLWPCRRPALRPDRRRYDRDRWSARDRDRP